MEYLSKEELEDITNSLLESPTKEMLNQLNEKYNGGTKMVSVSDTVVSNVDTEMPSNLEINSTLDSAPLAQEVNPVEINVNESLPGIGIPNMGVQPVEVQGINSPSIPTFEVPNNLEASGNLGNIPSVQEVNPAGINVNESLPSLEVPKVEMPNNNPVSFSGNLWEPQTPSINNLMETTDNFNTTPNTMPNMNANQNAPFFNPMNNSNQQMMGNVQTQPSMFGQIQDSYKAA